MSGGETEAITARGLEELKAEIARLEGEERQRIAERILRAREHGDLSENAEYHAAKEAQAHLETRILRLREKLLSAEVIDITRLSGDQVKFGARVTVLDEETEEEKTYRIVGAYEADMKAGSISISSPLAKALIGRKVGESVEVPAPGGARAYEITAVQFR